MNSEETFQQLRTDYTVSPGKNLDTQTSFEGAVDVLVSTEVARKALSATGVVDEWRTLLSQFPEDSSERAVIERSIDEAQLVAAGASQVTGELDNSRVIAELQEKLFDYYSPELFYAAARQRLEALEKLLLPADLEPARALVADKLARYSDLAQSSYLEHPTQQTLERVGEWLKSQFGDLFDELDEDGIEKYDASQIVAVFQKAMLSTPTLRERGWIAKEVEREKTAISTYSSKHEVVVPTKRTATKKKVKELIVHEVFGHALRSALAEESEIPVADQGTATYARFEESFLIALEQCLSGSYDSMRGVDHYLAVGLSVTGGESKDDIASLFESIHMLDKAKTGIDDAIARAARNLTSTQIRRTFVGMTDVDDGIAHRKDIDYLHGLNDSWKLLNYATEHDVVDEVMRWLLVGKFNPFNAQDRDLIESFVPMPKVLAGFFKAA